jgi:hypothetical protein
VSTRDFIIVGVSMLFGFIVGYAVGEWHEFKLWFDATNRDA